MYDYEQRVFLGKCRCSMNLHILVINVVITYYHLIQNIGLSMKAKHKCNPQSRIDAHLSMFHNSMQTRIGNKIHFICPFQVVSLIPTHFKTSNDVLNVAFIRNTCNKKVADNLCTKVMTFGLVFFIKLFLQVTLLYTTDLKY